MGIYLNPRNDLFKNDLNSDIYVDKSMIIERLNSLIDTNDNLMCISRPRRFGKTMATNLISAFYSKGCDSREQFSNLKIAKLPDWDKNLNKFNVIKLSPVGFYSDIEDKKGLSKEISRIVNKEMIKAFPDAEIELTDSLGISIVKAYATTGEKFIFIMDEYDFVVREMVSPEALNAYLEFLNGLFKSPEVREALHLAYLTGILPIVRDKTQYRLNEFTESSITDAGQLSGFIGFTEEEVQDLCQQYDMDFSECKRWYKGYKIGNNNAIYNPCSIVEAMDNKKYDYYWTMTGSYKSITDYVKLNFDGIRDDIIKMIGGGSVDVNVRRFLNTMTDFNTKDDVFTYLIHLGYLAYDVKEKLCWIPNNEIRSEWINAVECIPEYSNMVEMVKESKLLFNETIAGNETAVAKALDKAHIIASNPKTYNNEGAFQSAICLAYFYAYNFYTVIQELPTGKGYADVVFIPVHPEQNKPAIIIELKVNNSVDTALNQIKNKQYSQALSHYSGNILFVGINYNKETKEHQCKIERFVK